MVPTLGTAYLGILVTLVQTGNTWRVEGADAICWPQRRGNQEEGKEQAAAVSLAYVLPSIHPSYTRCIMATSSPDIASKFPRRLQTDAQTPNVWVLVAPIARPFGRFRRGFTQWRCPCSIAVYYPQGNCHPALLAVHHLTESQAPPRVPVAVPGGRLGRS